MSFLRHDLRVPRPLRIPTGDARSLGWKPVGDTRLDSEFGVPLFIEKDGEKMVLSCSGDYYYPDGRINRFFCRLGRKPMTEPEQPETPQRECGSGGMFYTVRRGYIVNDIGINVLLALGGLLGLVKGCAIALGLFAVLVWLFFFILSLL
jgi:hypothetical protein